MIFTKIAQELNLQNIYAKLNDLVNSIEQNPELFYSGKNYQSLINPILKSFQGINSSTGIFYKNIMLVVLDNILKFFNNPNVKKNQSSIQETISLKNALKNIKVK